MKARKTFIIMVAALSIMAIFAAAAHAGWYYCTVEKAGRAGSNVNIKLKVTKLPGGSGGLAVGDTQWCTPAADAANQMLAIALTAMINGAEVHVNITETGTPPEPTVAVEELLTMYLMD